MFSGGFLFFHCLVSSVLSRVETVSGFWFGNQDYQAVVDFGVGAGRCHKVTREKN